jgi:hypothetical protein
VSGRDKERAYRDLGRILKVFAGQPASDQPSARGGLEQQGADMRLLLALHRNSTEQ